MNVSNVTRTAKLIIDIMKQKATTPLLAGSLPLEILIDIGIEKLIRDYTYILLSANLIDRHELQEKLKKNFNEKFDVKKFRYFILLFSFLI